VLGMVILWLRSGLDASDYDSMTLHYASGGAVDFGVRVWSEGG